MKTATKNVSRSGIVVCNTLTVIDLGFIDFPLDLAANSIDFLFRDRAVFLEVPPVVSARLHLNGSALSLRADTNGRQYGVDCDKMETDAGSSSSSSSLIGSAFSR